MRSNTVRASAIGGSILRLAVSTHVYVSSQLLGAFRGSEWFGVFFMGTEPLLHDRPVNSTRRPYTICWNLLIAYHMCVPRRIEHHLAPLNYPPTRIRANCTRSLSIGNVGFMRGVSLRTRSVWYRTGQADYQVTPIVSVVSCGIFLSSAPLRGWQTCLKDLLHVCMPEQAGGGYVLRFLKMSPARGARS